MNALKPTDWQEDVLYQSERLNYFLGGGRGRGATTLALLMILRACQKYPGSAHGFGRNHLRSLAEVEDTLQMLSVGVYGSAMSINRSQHTFKFPNGSSISFFCLADVNDLAKQQGISYDTLTFDEFGNASPVQMRWVDAMRANLRGASACPKRMVLLANPAGRGHGQIVNRFINKLPAWTPTKLEDGTEWIYCPATFRDNKHLPASYANDLLAAAGRDKELARAWSDNAWNIARGSILADVLDETKQMLPADGGDFLWKSPYVMPFLGVDWGTASPSVGYLAYRLPWCSVGRFPKGSLVLIDEVSSADPDDRSIGMGWSPGRLADDLNQMCDRWDVKNRSGCLDDARGLSPDETLIKTMQRYGLYFTRPTKGKAENLAIMRELLFNSKESNGRPGMWISARCEDWWECVPVLARDSIRSDIPDAKSGMDHSYDASAYCCSHEVPILRQGRTIGGF